MNIQMYTKQPITDINQQTKTCTRDSKCKHKTKKSQKNHF